MTKAVSLLGIDLISGSLVDLLPTLELVVEFLASVPKLVLELDVQLLIINELSLKLFRSCRKHFFDCPARGSEQKFL